MGCRRRVLFGYTEDEWLGRNESMILAHTPELETPPEPGMQHARACGYRRKDGTGFSAGRLTRAVEDERGDIIASSTVIEPEFAVLRHSLEPDRITTEQLARAIDYVLREPIRILPPYAKLLARRFADKLGPQGNQLLKYVFDSAMSTRKILDAALEYACVRIGERSPSPLPVDQGVDAALAALSQAVEESSATITRSALPTVFADPGRVAQLLRHLIAKAIQYRKPGSRPEIHISAERQDEFWAVSVRDEGIGFDPKHARIIFLPFNGLGERGHRGGPGIGLAICRSIVEAEGGRIRAKSKPGDGALFTFTLPAFSSSSTPTVA